MNLSLHSSACIPSCQRFYLFCGNKVEVTVDSVLQSGSSHSEFEGSALVGLSQQTVDDTARERVTATYTVDDRIDIVTFLIRRIPHRCKSLLSNRCALPRMIRAM